MSRWRIDFSVWTYSHVKRPSDDASLIVRDEPMRGACDPHVFVDADCFDEAVRLSKAVVLGLRLDERVWKIKVRAIAEQAE